MGMFYVVFMASAYFYPEASSTWPVPWCWKGQGEDLGWMHMILFPRKKEVHDVGILRVFFLYRNRKAFVKEVLNVFCL